VVRRRGRPTRFLAAVVFTDIAGSTEVAARLGDDGWKRLLERYQRLVRSALYRFGGREIDTAGDGVYATFESPARAITFALDVAERAEALDIQVRSGVHMGEVELIGGKAGGIAVHIGARIAALAEPGEVLVSGTVRDLVTGSAVGFEDRGTSELKGVPGRWALYSATALELPTALPEEARVPLRERIGVGLRSTRWRVALVLIVAVAVAVSALAVNVLLQPRYLPGVEANSVGRISAVGNGILSSVPVGSLPDAIAFGEGSLWVTDTTMGSVARIDPEDSRVIQTIEVEGSPNAVAVGHGSVWVPNGNARTVSRVSPATNRVIATVTVGNGPSGVATDERWVWVTNRLDGTLARIDPQNSAATIFHVGTNPAGVATGAGSVWVSDFDSASVVRVDPASGATAARIYVGNGPTSVAASDDQVWVVNSRDGTVTRIDPSSNTVAATVNVGADPGTVAAAESVWVTVASTSEIVRIDPGSNTVVRRIPVQSRPRGIAIAGADTWFTARAATGSHRGGILRIVAEDAHQMPSTLDPALSEDCCFFLRHILLTNDGLVGFKRVGGADGLTLVPDLAISIPTPTDGGRTYTFLLRPGIVYSDGKPVRAVDVRNSLDRIAIISPWLADYLFGKSLEGVKACENAPAPCDLSSLVHVDEQANSVTFRLTTPDPEFLYRLASPEFAVLPADTPREPATAPLPATGPYMMQPFDADGGIRLVRNQRFVEWSHEAQPDGYPNEIVWRIAAEGEDLVGSVAAGEDDATSAYNAFSPDRVAGLSTQFADQLYAFPPANTFFEFMNTKLPPFNQLAVRKAVNFATDRARVVEIYGGRSSGRETCQAQPPGYPGYEPFCPYTVNPGPGGAWLAPDLAEARNLIAGAGVAGTPVTVRAWGEFESHVAVGSYFVELLDELGFDASLTKESLFGLGGSLDAYTADWQMTGNFFVGGFPTPYSEIIAHFTCPDFPVEPGSYGNYAAFCDPEIDALALRAYELQATDSSAANHAWAEIDHLIVDQSPAVAVFNPVTFVFVSKRVGNVQLNPQLGILLDQLWVQ
jgi:peptide/nickel transport system substrate-binding protein